MNDMPFSREASGPPQLRQILADIEWLKDMIRSMSLDDSSATIGITKTAVGTLLEVRDNGGTRGTSSRQVWL